MPQPGHHELRVITPSLIELSLVTAKQSEKSPLREWNFAGPEGMLRLPFPSTFAVISQGTNVPVRSVGFRRRVLYAPLKQWDLRIDNRLYLRLGGTLAPDAEVKVANPALAPVRSFAGRAGSRRWSPVIHVNQTGYLPQGRKVAIVGYYLGSLGELDLGELGSKSSASNAFPAFTLVDSQSGKEVFRGTLRRRPDAGFSRQCYQQVFEADFSGFKEPGEYCVAIQGLGWSFPFRIDEGVIGAFTRTYALGIYHQRCGTDNALPFTRFTHGPCHTAPAEVPTMTARFAAANESLKKESANFKDEPRHRAPQLANVAACLYPFVNPGPIDVSGGHHDAGDYSKYTINSAGFIHHLVFAVDAFPGVAKLDNLGLPESGDGKSDLLQEAKWEADFLAKMQDRDGGFYFLVYPRNREYESDVLPDKGDPQVVFPKTTSVTAAATAALAQCASSPAFKRQFPDAAALYLVKAKQGWDFLQRALERFGEDGAYQKITHYGDEFLHDDEIAWAACELYIATGDEQFHKAVLARLKPTDPNNRKWGWWRLYDAWGCAIRSYGFAVQSGKLPREKVNQALLAECRAEIEAAGAEQLRRSNESAYGTSFPDETKRARSAGWYFFSDAAFDLATANQLDYPEKKDPRPALRAALMANLDYEQGCNPVNVTYLTGLGQKRQLEVVHQYAQNDRRALPPSGIPLGNIQEGISWVYVYGKVPSELSFPPDSADTGSYPFYDRWSDAFNLSQEFVILHQARGLAALAWLMAQSSLANQDWKSAAGTIELSKAQGADGKAGLRALLVAPGLDLSSARIVWEGSGVAPRFGNPVTLPVGSEPPWVEAEAQLVDGRRVFAVRER